MAVLPLVLKPAVPWQKQEKPEVGSIIVCIFTGVLTHSEEVVAL